MGKPDTRSDTAAWNLNKDPTLDKNLVDFQTQSLERFEKVDQELVEMRAESESRQAIKK